MRSRVVAAAAAALAVAGLGACTARPQTALSGSASVTVDGKDTKIHVVRCSQLQWYRTIDIGSDYAGATIRIEVGERPLTTTSVRIRNLGGFTGMYSKGDGGDADTSFSGDKFTITGTANGFKTDKPNEPASVAFKIIATC